MKGKSPCIVFFEQSKLVLTRASYNIEEILNDMLYDFVMHDVGNQPFVCNICGKQSIRKNPKQIYCSNCQKKRYQVSRRKKKMEKTNNAKA